MKYVEQLETLTHLMPNFSSVNLLKLNRACSLVAPYRRE